MIVPPSSPLVGLSARVRASEHVAAAVVGAGRSGRAAAALLRDRGAAVTVLDDREEALEGLPEGTRGRPLDERAVAAAELVVLSPGVPRSRPELVSALERRCLIGEVELASWFLSVPLIGITGTNGKSTTTALVGHLLSTAGLRAFVGGNLGDPLCDLARSREGTEVAVVELSSFQLESVETASFRIGAWLNLQPDHLDRYPDLDAYARAKARLFARVDPGGLVVASWRDPIVRAAAEGLDAPRVRWFQAGASLEGRPGTEVLGLEARRDDERYRLDGPGLLGPHNHENAAAAIEIARAAGASPDAVALGLASFRGLPHRLALVHEARGVRWYDDSKATNVAAAVTAVRAMTGPTVLVAGGRDKGGSWAPLVAEAIEGGRVVAVLAIGEAASLVEAAFLGRLPVERVGTLEGAVTRARALVPPGGVVLLAPACSSFDQFPSYAARGEAFARLARGEEIRP